MAGSASWSERKRIPTCSSEHGCPTIPEGVLHCQQPDALPQGRRIAQLERLDWANCAQRSGCLVDRRKFGLRRFGVMSWWKEPTLSSIRESSGRPKNRPLRVFRAAQRTLRHRWRVGRVRVEDFRRAHLIAASPGSPKNDGGRITGTTSSIQRPYPL